MKKTSILILCAVVTVALLCLASTFTGPVVAPTISMGQWMTWTNPLDNSLFVSNTITHSNTVTHFTNGSVRFNGGINVMGVVTGTVFRSTSTAAMIDGVGSEILLDDSGLIELIPQSSILAGNMTCGTVSSSGFTGNGAGITGLNASSIASGTVPLTALSSAVVTNGDKNARSLSNTVSFYSISTNYGGIQIGQWFVQTNPADSSLVITNTTFKTTPLVMRTNGAVDLSANMLTNVASLNATNMANGAGWQLAYASGFGFKMGPPNWGVGGVQFENDPAGGFVLANSANGATIQLEGHGNNIQLFTGASGEFQFPVTFDNSITSDGGSLTTDGSGDLTVLKLDAGSSGISDTGNLSITGTSSLDNGSITTDGSGDLSAVNFSGNGASLTALNANNLASGTLPQARLPGFVITNANTTRFTNAAPQTNTTTLDVAGAVNHFSTTTNHGAVINQAAVSNIVSTVNAGPSTNLAAVVNSSTVTNAGAVTTGGPNTNLSAVVNASTVNTAGDNTNQTTLEATGTVSTWGGLANYTTNFLITFNATTFTANGYTNNTPRAQYINIFGTAGSNIFYMRGGANGRTVASLPLWTNINTANGGGYALGVNCGVQIVNGAGIRLQVVDSP